jgi:hypothetical protein
MDQYQVLLPGQQNIQKHYTDIFNFSTEVVCWEFIADDSSDEY